MKSPIEIYKYENKRIKKYKKDFNEIIESLDVDSEVKDEMLKLFIWYGNASSIKSKAYQEMKTFKK